MLSRLLNWMLASSQPKVRRSPKWGAVRQAHLGVEPVCQACRGEKRLEVHHVIPVHVDPTRELDPRNLLTLCEAPGRHCHLIFGHAYDWRLHVPKVREYLSQWRLVVAEARLGG